MKNLKIKDVEDLHDGFLAVCEAVSQTLGAEGKYAVTNLITLELSWLNKWL